MIPEENHGIQCTLEVMVDYCLQLAAGPEFSGAGKLQGVGIRQLAASQ